VGDRVVEGSFAVEIRLPVLREELEVIVPAALVEAFAVGVRDVGSIRWAVALSAENRFDDFTGGVEKQGVPEIAGDGFVWNLPRKSQKLE
jgi:hypothetical protein